MADHERFVLLAARRISEPLSTEEEADLEGHLAECPTCRSIAAGMRRDDIRLRAELGPATVSPRVRQRVLAEASGRRRIDPRLILGLAAALLLGVLGAPLLAGGLMLPAQDPSATTPSPSPSLAVVSPSVAVASPTPVAPAPSPSPTPSGPLVIGSYIYGTTPPRRDTIAAHFEGGPVGEWSRRIPAVGEGTFFGGPVTCLVISGSDAWLAGPATTATDGSKDGAVMIHVHDGGPDGEGDAVLMWQATPGQTITTMTEWCENRFIPADPYPLTSGDVVVQDGASP